MVANRKIFLTLSILLWGSVLHSQEFVFSNIQKLPATINSDAEESMPLLSPDGKTLFFTRLMHSGNVGGKYSGNDIWKSERNGVNWKQADNSLPFNDKGNNVIVGVGRDGKAIYLMQTTPTRPVKGIYFSKFLNNRWTDPELVPIEGIDHEDFVGFHVSSDFDVIFISMKGRDSRGEEDLYVCIKTPDGQWLPPRNLGSTINTSGFEISPFLSADKKRLYFASNGHKGFGDADIFYSDRLYDSWEAWSLPKNLGEEINTTSFEGYFSVFGDSVCFFASNRGGGLANLYQVQLSLNVTKKDYIELTLSEMKEVFGVDIQQKLIFENDRTIDLTAVHKELLWYVGSKLIGKTEVKIQIEVSREMNREVAEKRIAAIRAHLALSGVEGSRIVKLDHSSEAALRPNEIRLIFVK